MKLLKTIRADSSDTFIFDKAALPDEWAVSGAFMFANLDLATSSGKTRAAFRGGFLGIDSFGWSTLAQIVEATTEQHAAAVELLAARLVEHCGAPDLHMARRAAQDEIAFAASLCDHPSGMLIAVSRRDENAGTHESFRTLRSNGRAKPAPVFSFELVREDDASAEQADLTNLADLADLARGVRR